MAYIINTYNTAQLTVVEDGTIDQTTDLKLVGKNYAGYGEIQNENFIFLLENFAGNNEPPKAIVGQIWYDAANLRLKYYNGSKWSTAGGSEVGETPPSGSSEGDFWWDSTNEQLYVWNGTEYILVGPQGVGNSLTQFQSKTIRDTSNIARPVIVSIIDDEIVHIVSNIEFYIANDELPNYPGFDRIHNGLTLKNTINSTAGQTSTTHRYWGTASNADRLGGLTVDKFVQSDGASFSERVGFGDEGISIGNSDDIRIKIINDNQAVIANQQGTNIFFQVRDTAGNLRMPVRFEDAALLPGWDILFDINASSASFSSNVIRAVDVGSSTAPFQNMYASSFKGVADSAVSLSVTSATGTIQASADVNAVPNTIAARTATGDINANVFFGTATSARFADLAEIYEADKDYEPGTVLVFGGDKEVTESKKPLDNDVIGVVSTAPAYLMNNSANGIPVALRGRVPCKVKGPVKKGSRLITSDTPGVAIASDTYPYPTTIVGRSLVNDSDTEIRLIEIVL